MDKEPSKIERNQDRARNDFTRSTNEQGKEAPKGRNSEMVKNSKPSLEEGPTPPGGLYETAKRKQFNAEWRKEIKAAGHEMGLPRQLEPETVRKKRLYEEFLKVRGQGMSR